MSSPLWHWDASRHAYYCYDSSSDELVYQNGFRARRPNHISIATLLSPPPSTPRTLPNQTQTNPNATCQRHYTHQQSNTSRHHHTHSQNSTRQQNNTHQQNNTYPQNSIYQQNYTAQVSQSGHTPLPESSRRTGKQPVQDATPRRFSPNALAADFTPMSINDTPQSSTRSQVIQRQIATESGPVIQVYNRQTEVAATFQSEPKEVITDHNLYQSGVRAVQRVGPGPNDEEALYSTFKRRDRARSFFVEGKIFLTLWVEPAGESSKSGVSGNTAGSNSIAVTKGRLGENVFSKVRRFVVVRAGDLHCTTLPVTTYGGQGLAKKGVKKSDHAIIYTGKYPPSMSPGEAPSRGENGMRPNAIRVDPDDPKERLDVMSRIDFGKPHTIHHNLKVKSFGKVNRASMQQLIYQFNAVWTEGSTRPGAPLRAALTTQAPPAPSSAATGNDTLKAAIDSLLAQGYSRGQVRQMLRRRRSQEDEEEDEESSSAESDSDGHE